MPVEQSASDMEYRLILGNPDLEAMRIVEHVSFNWNTSIVEIFILGASHAVKIHTPRGTITELLTCVKPNLDDSVSIVNGPADCDSQYAFAHIGLQGQMDIQKIDTIRQLSREISDRMLRHTFPGVCGITLPVTEVRWSITADTLTVNTRHTYPNEGVSIMSTSVFEANVNQGDRN